MNSLFQQSDSVPIVGNRYRLISQLGVGGFGHTFLAQDLHLPDRPRCVVKRLVARTTDAKHLKTARRLFDTEAKVLYQLGKHDQIPSLFAHFEDNQEFYLVQEFIEGESLSRQIVKGKPWSEEQVIVLLYDILQVLAFVHQQNVIHRDIKPSNLMRRRKDGKIVLIDFGAVKQVSVTGDDPPSGMTDLTISIGTKGYTSNEQLAGKPRFCSDVYAVGIAGLQALTGMSPKHLGEDTVTGEVAWRVHVPTVSPELAEVIDRMVCYDFRDRYPTAIEALEALEQLPIQLSEYQFQPWIEAVELDSTVEFRSAIDARSTQLETGATNATHNGALTNSHDETLTLTTDNDSFATSIYHPESLQEPGEDPPATALSKLPKQLTKRSTIVAGGLAIAGATVLSVSLPSLKFGNHSTVPFVSSVNSSTVPSLSSIPNTKSLSPQQQATHLLGEADRLRKQRQYSQALVNYDQAIKLQPNLARAYWGQCDSLSGLRQFDQAIVACNDALDLQPDYPKALWSKGKVFKQQDRDLEALRLFEQATALDPNFAEAWVDLGIALQGVGRSVEAIEALDQAIALNRNLAEAWSVRGTALWNLGRFDQAAASLDKALQIQPDAADARALRELARKELGY
ncbi:MAG: tetratricopeptide repeat protein [Leptolyngbyaceae cyanobacterium RU_5_1]|nr:tetratricopeptide repeat protein [Leptolyngbyaceae cyanobacterium RU_5_1]